LEREAQFMAPVGEVRLLDYGFYSRVLETDGGWIVRVARTADAAERHERECRVLPALARNLPLAIPEPVSALRAGDAAPYGATAYRRLSGRAMTQAEAVEGEWRKLARQLGRELARLHDVKLAPDVASEVPRFHMEDFAKLREVVSPGLRERLAFGEWAKVDAWWEQFMADRSLREWEPVLAHGDVWWGNLLVDDERISGMVDWEFLSHCDPAWELGTTQQFGDAFYPEVVAEYLHRRELDANWAHRADQWWALRTFFGVQFAIDREDEGEWVDSLRKLREGPILG
jgi:aminoglycoside phosphotransferase (APT) family kinase protein